MGADKVYNPKADGGDVAEWMIAANEGYGVDIVLEMSGASSSVDAAFRGVRNGGRVTLFGIPSSPVRIDVAESMIFKNLTVLALNGRRIFETWYKTRWLLETGAVDINPVITKQVALEDVEDAMETLAAGEAGKIILRPSGDFVVPEEPPAGHLLDANVEGQDLHR
jgi:threonine 3-dehydrogenase